MLLIELLECILELLPCLCSLLDQSVVLHAFQVGLETQLNLSAALSAIVVGKVKLRDLGILLKRLSKPVEDLRAQAVLIVQLDCFLSIVELYVVVSASVLGKVPDAFDVLVRTRVLNTMALGFSV